MKRRTILQAGLGLAIGSPLLAAMRREKLDAVANVLKQGTESGLIDAAAIYVQQGDTKFSRSFGAAKTENAVFLLASISKPISIAAVMTLFDRGLFHLDDPVRKFIPEFTASGRDKVTMRQLMTHVSGLPDQLPQNAELRSRHAGLAEFVEAAIRTPLLFTPGSRYSYSSMAILLATEVAQRISRKSIASLVDETVFGPLEMKHSALGVGRLNFESLMRCQVENAAPESGAGNPATKDWNWNSRYWRSFGAPWGGAHGSAADVARFLDAFLNPQGKLLKPDTARSMITNHNPASIRPRGLGFDLGKGIAGPYLSDNAFGHGGSTGTLCWADPKTDSIFVVLTTLPSNAADPHPREVTSRLFGEAVGS